MEASRHQDGPPQPWDNFLQPAIAPFAADQAQQLSGKRILVTGAGGFLGSALARALMRLPLRELVLLDQSEYGLYQLEQGCSSAFPVRYMVGSVTSNVLLSDVFQQHAPHVVLHAAALKHVPLMQLNPLAAAETNILGTQAVVQQAVQSGAERVVLLSTDKAVDPINVMGATKRMAEQVTLSAATKSQQTVCTVARLCNVLGSTGSVAPRFVQQIAQGGPLTLTHRDATRFFLSTQDAVNFLLHAATCGHAPQVLVPKLHHPHRVNHLAQFLIDTVAPQTSIPVVETGLRDGDKLHEQLLSASEQGSATTNGTHVEATTRFDRTQLTAALTAIAQAVSSRNEEKLRQAIQLAVPEYQSQPRSSSLAVSA